jgi:hypothetical protein
MEWGIVALIPVIPPKDPNYRGYQKFQLFLIIIHLNEAEVIVNDEIISMPLDETPAR